MYCYFYQGPNKLEEKRKLFSVPATQIVIDSNIWNTIHKSTNTLLFFLRPNDSLDPSVYYPHEHIESQRLNSYSCDWTLFNWPFQAPKLNTV